MLKIYLIMLKKFESFIDGVDDDEVFEEMLNNPMSKTHDLFIFIYKEGFKENESGSYDKTLDIEKMNKVTTENYKSMNGIYMRARVNNADVATIWWPKDATDLIINKSSDDMELWLLDTIEKHMIKKMSDDDKKRYNDMVDKLTKVGKQRINKKKQIKKFKI